MNLTRAERVRLGFFLITGISLFFGAVLVLAGMKLWERRDLYVVSFEESVSGLEVSAQVRYQGLRVGRVESMRIDPRDAQAIEVTLALNEGARLHRGTEAMLVMSGITGLKIIDLVPGDARAELLPPGSRLPARASLIDKISDRAEAITEKVDRIASIVERWTGAANQQRVEELLETTNRLIVGLDIAVLETKDPLIAALEEVGRTGASVRGTSEEARLALKEVRGELGSTLVAARTTLEEARRILKAVDGKALGETVASANSAMKSLDQHLSADETAQAFGELRVALGDLSKLVRELDLTVRASREDLVMSLQHVRQATQDLREFSRIIAQDPSVLLRGTQVSE